MAVVQVEPTKDHPIPYDLSEEKPATLIEEIAVAGNTAELQVEMGAPLEVSEGDAAREKELLEAVATAQKPANLTNQTTAFAAAAFLRTYGAQLAMDAAQARSAITHKLMEIADCGDPRYELKALELLGKHSDIGIFTERSEITINYKSPEELEKAIKEKVKNLLNATVIDVTPAGGASEEELDEVLGVVDMDAEEDEADDEELDDERDISI